MCFYLHCWNLRHCSVVQVKLHFTNICCDCEHAFSALFTTAQTVLRFPSSYVSYLFDVSLNPVVAVFNEEKRCATQPGIMFSLFNVNQHSQIMSTLMLPQFHSNPPASPPVLVEKKDIYIFTAGQVWVTVVYGRTNSLAVISLWKCFNHVCFMFPFHIDLRQSIAWRLLVRQHCSLYL